MPIIKHLFKQKLFQMVLKKIWHKLESVSEKHLAAIAFVFKLTPHQVLVNDIAKASINCMGSDRSISLAYS